jgi:hypothetical protein
MYTTDHEPRATNVRLSRLDDYTANAFSSRAVCVRTRALCAPVISEHEEFAQGLCQCSSFVCVDSTRSSVSRVSCLITLSHVQRSAMQPVVVWLATAWQSIAAAHRLLPSCRQSRRQWAPGTTCCLMQKTAMEVTMQRDAADKTRSGFTGALAACSLQFGVMEQLNSWRHALGRNA